MGHRKYVLESTKNEIAEMDLNQSLTKFYWLSIGLSLICPLAVLLPMLLNESLETWLFIASWWIPIFAALYFLPAQAIVSERFFGTKHRLLAGSFKKLLEKDGFRNNFFVVGFYAGLKCLCRNLGKHGIKENADELCNAGKAYLVKMGMVAGHGNGRWSRGAASELASFVDNPRFYEPGYKRPYAALRRHSQKWADDGEKLFRTKEQAEFESWG